MGDFDDISRAIGRIEGKQDAIIKSQGEQWTKLEGIEKDLTSHRIKTAGIAGTISLFVSGLVAWFKGGGSH